MKTVNDYYLHNLPQVEEFRTENPYYPCEVGVGIYSMIPTEHGYKMECQNSYVGVWELKKDAPINILERFKSAQLFDTQVKNPASFNREEYDSYCLSGW